MASRKSLKPRYKNPGALEARIAFVSELKYHGFNEVAKLYQSEKLHEKNIMALMGYIAWKATEKGDERTRKIAQGLALLAAYLHEYKHDRPASKAAGEVFWQQLERGLREHSHE